MHLDPLSRTYFFFIHVTVRNPDVMLPTYTEPHGRCVSGSGLRVCSEDNFPLYLTGRATGPALPGVTELPMTWQFVALPGAH